MSNNLFKIISIQVLKILNFKVWGQILYKDKYIINEY